MSVNSAPQGLKDIIVVVHGIGKQQRNATVRSVANRMAVSDALRGNRHPVAPQPLGYFYTGVNRLVETRLVDDRSRLAGTDLESIGVAEVFWADIPHDVVKEGRTMEETLAWARTVVARAKALWEDAKAVRSQGIVEPDFALAAEVLDEIIETIYVLENLCFLADKAGVFTFDLRDVLEEYLGDVQLVAEFGYFRTDIVGRFHQAMADIYDKEVKQGNPDVRLHIVAHSEGTVVSFLGLLHAMSGHRLVPADAAAGKPATIDGQAGHPAWLSKVAGFMTIGSPIDKHLLLWPRIWEGLQPAAANALFRDRPIRWRNYYDYGDPVGFKLNTTRLWLGADQQQVTAFEFEEKHDHGFARYVLPGKAHNDYWDDDGVFEHFITTVVRPAPSPAPVPKSRPLVALISPGIPYVLSFLVLLAGTYLLYKQVSQFAHPEPAPLEAARITQDLGIVRSAGVGGWKLLTQVFGVSVLVASASLIARLPRMAAGIRWKLIAAAGFLAGCAAYWGLLAEDSRNEIGAPFCCFGPAGPTLGVCILALAVGLVGLIATYQGKSDRRQRWLWQGMRPLILCGALGVGLIVLGRLYPEKLGGGTKLTADETAFVAQAPAALRDSLRSARLTRAELDQLFGRKDAADPIDPAVANRHLANLVANSSLLSQRPPVWPVVLATAAFLYLWWLAVLLFDLAFVWHRYIRNSVTNDRLHDWYCRKRSLSDHTSRQP